LTRFRYGRIVDSRESREDGLLVSSEPGCGTTSAVGVEAKPLVPGVGG
jgi:hypothetical protein